MARQIMVLDSQREQMKANWLKGSVLAESDCDDIHDPRPVVKLFNPCGAATWLLTELVPDEDGDLAFGLCDLGMGFPEIGYVSLEELAGIALAGGLYIERDEHFTANKTLSEYAADARRLGRIEV